MRRRWRSLRKTFYYVFDPQTDKGGGLPQIELHTIDGPFSFGGAGIQPIPLMHGARPILGFRFGDFAYLTDTNHIPDARLAAAGRRQDGDSRRAAPPAASDALHRVGSAGGGRAAASRSGPISRTSVTTCRTSPPTRRCRPVSSSPMMDCS